jgi:hypothetical protein
LDRQAPTNTSPAYGRDKFVYNSSFIVCPIYFMPDDGVEYENNQDKKKNCEL